MPLHHAENHAVLQGLQADFDHISPSISMDKIPSGGLIVKLYCIVTTPFNDGSATIKIGAGANSDDFAKNGDIDITKVGVTEIDIVDVAASLIDVHMTIDPKSATQGAGRTIIQFIAP